MEDQEDVEMVDAEQEAVEQYLVLKCNSCLTMAWLIAGCGHLFCPSCIETLVYPPRQCPTCKFHICERMIFPIYSSSAKEDSTPDCGICLDSAAPQALVTKCGHIFCKDCLLPWFRTKHECPVCREHASPRFSIPVGFTSNESIMNQCRDRWY